MLANEITHTKQVQAIRDVMQIQASSPAYHLSQVLLMESPPRLIESEAKITPINPNLNPGQINAIEHMLFRCQNVGIIHGPPGTGKTTTVVELILQCVQRDMRVLCTAPSNIAVDNIVEKLAGKVPICRLGHPARIMSHISKYSFDSLVQRSEQNELTEGIHKELAGYLSQLKGKASRGERQAIKSEMFYLRKELKQRQQRAVQEVLDNARVVLSTNVGASQKNLREFAQKIHNYDIVIIDEAAQALEASCWIPILLGKKLILAGDHKQLAPTIKSQQAAKQGLDVTMLDRLIQNYHQISAMLEVQYRMNRLIMQWSSDTFYESRLVADESVADQVIDRFQDEGPLLMIDTAGCEMGEGGEISKFNVGEAGIVLEFIKEMRSIGVKDLAVITQYNAQVELIKSKLSENIEVSTVDGFQGREKEVIIISLVRSNTDFEVGFLTDPRRLNVAVTRARKLLCVICDSDTVSGPKAPDFLKGFIAYMNENAAVRSAEEYRDSEAVEFNQGEVYNSHIKGQKPQKEKREVQTNQKTNAPSIFRVLKQFVDTFMASNSIQTETDYLIGDQLAYVHRYAESLSLFHKTIGSKNKRRILLSKVKDEDQTSPPFQPSYIELLPDDLPETDVYEHPDIGIPTKLSNSKPKAAHPIEDDMDFLENSAIQNTKCIFAGCNTNITNLRTICRHCNRVFCFTHALAEVHGCGEAARKLARDNLTREKPKKLRPSERQDLKKKLEETKARVARKKPQRKKKK